MGVAYLKQARQNAPDDIQVRQNIRDLDQRARNERVVIVLVILGAIVAGFVVYRLVFIP